MTSAHDAWAAELSWTPTTWAYCTAASPPGPGEPAFWPPSRRNTRQVFHQAAMALHRDAGDAPYHLDRLILSGHARDLFEDAEEETRAHWSELWQHACERAAEWVADETDRARGK